MEELQEKVNMLMNQVDTLVKEVGELKETVHIMKSTHSFDMGRVFEEIDKINNN